MFTLGFEKTSGMISKLLGKTHPLRSEMARALKAKRNFLRETGAGPRGFALADVGPQQPGKKGAFAVIARRGTPVSASLRKGYHVTKTVDDKRKLR